MLQIVSQCASRPADITQYSVCADTRTLSSLFFGSIPGDKIMGLVHGFCSVYNAIPKLFGAKVCTLRWAIDSQGRLNMLEGLDMPLHGSVRRCCKEAEISISEIKTYSPK
jgi:hypothetical protein